ncbi:MAG: efflux RND transporter periplasmic adaptor subunit [Kiritimatiellales bacterium]|nr:efflux RND transporter periplasmic adaptor subunit [Kiritimatiellales bacterium]MCF7864034.1 efflux RND transporter periplasmic adaptor subunit [Kiritimatiellales bacterium]
MKSQLDKLKKLWQRRRVKVGVVVAVVVLGTLAFKPGNDASRVDPNNSHFCRVQRGDLVVSILQTGELEAKTSLDIMNDAYRDAKIIAIVEDGATVTNGQLLVELESSELKERYLNQQSSVATADADLLHAQEELEIAKLKYASDLESAILKVELAKLDLQKYTEAEYPQMVLKAESDIKLAEQELKKARSELEGTQELYEKGYSNRQELESDQLGVDRKDIEVRNKTKDLEILQNYTYIKRLKELKNDVLTTESTLERLKKSFASDVLSKQASIESKRTRLEIEGNQLVTREEQLTNTKVFADFDGQVFYPSDRRSAKVEKGANVNFRQKILSYPDLSAWNIKVGIPEAMIDKVSLGQEAVATLDAVPGLVLRGQVEKISAVPDSQDWFSSGVKTYTIMVDVLTKLEATLKPGMSATVEIVTDQLRDVLYVPIQSVVSKKDQHYVYVVKHGRKELQEVQTGKYNTYYIQIIKGLEEGDELLLYAEVELNAEAQLKKSPLAQTSGKTKEQTQE